MASTAVGNEGEEDQIARLSAKREQRTEEGRGEIIHDKRKRQRQEKILAEHLDGLERHDVSNFEKPHKRAWPKGKIESNEQSKKGGQPKRLCGKRRGARQSKKL